jgi:hypothetical protein
MILLVYLEMATELLDALGQERNLNLSATGVLLVQLELADQLLPSRFPFFRHRCHFPAINRPSRLPPSLTFTPYLLSTFLFGSL